ncbi:MAG: hypothetical protein QM742_00530 [Aquabacterium sp.]
MKFPLQTAMQAMPAWMLTALCSTAYAAPLTNGDFSQGTTGWQLAGDASVQQGSLWGIELGPAPWLVLGTATTWTDDDAPQAAGAFNVSGHDPLAAGAADGLEAFAGLTTSALGANVYEGSAAQRTLDVQAGQRVSFTWRVLTRDNGSRANEADTAWLVTQSGSQSEAQVQALADIGTQTMSSTATGWLDSGAQHHSFTIHQTGTLTLGWLIADVQSFGNTSLLMIGDVQVSAVPEPQALGLMLAGLWTVRAVRRARQ